MSAPVMNPRLPVPPPPPPPRQRMPLRNRIIFLAVAWLIVLMPFLFWRGTWFGRPLSDQQLNDYLHDTGHARKAQHALVQVGERMARHDPTVLNWYPDLVELASSPVEEIRSTDAWVMGQDPTRPDFHQALLKMLKDPSPTVRGNAALALVRFNDSAGHDQIVALLQPATVTAPSRGQISDTARPGTAVHQYGTIAKLKTGREVIEIRAPIAGRVRSLAVQTGDTVAAGREIATIAPSTNQVWEALRALYLIGRLEDISAIQPYQQETGDMPQRLSQQATLTEKAIRERGK
jgi:biotin carboxyl carrier protein